MSGAGTDCATPPALAPSVSLGGSPDVNGLDPTSNVCDDRTFRNQRFAVPACRDLARNSLTPFWNSPLGVAADLRELFDHGEEEEDGDSDDDATEDGEDGEVEERWDDRSVDKQDDEDQADPHYPEDPLVGLHVPRF
jgi:hypothetical protein